MIAGYIGPTTGPTSSCVALAAVAVSPTTVAGGTVLVITSGWVMVSSASMSRSRAWTRFDPVPAVEDLGLELGLPQPQHGPQLVAGELLVDDGPHLLQPQAEVLQRDDPVQPAQLAGPVIPVAGVRIDVFRAQQPDRVVVPQHAHRHPAEPGEVSDTDHGQAHPAP